MLPISSVSATNFYSPAMLPASRVGSGAAASSVFKDPSAGSVTPRGQQFSPSECETCSNRKYQDGSDEYVSFKAPAHISPEASASVVRAHEQEHVANAYTEAAQKNGRVLSASVSLQTAVCPECGRSYVSGGTTTTQIKYYNEDNPYQKALKLADSIKFKGQIIDVWS